MTAEARDIEVCADWAGLGGPRVMGSLHALPSRGKEVFSFEFAPSWLAQHVGPSIDPGLSLYGGRQFARPGHANFGVFLDSCPDRWGRVLMRRREARRARKAGRAERKLLESERRMAGAFRVADG